MVSHSLVQILLFSFFWLLAWVPFCLLLAYKLQWRPFTPTSPEQKLPLVLTLYGVAPFVLAGLLASENLPWKTVGISSAHLLYSGSFFVGLAISVLGMAGLFGFFYSLGWIHWSFPIGGSKPSGADRRSDLSQKNINKKVVNDEAGQSQLKSPDEPMFAGNLDQVDLIDIQNSPWMLMLLLLALGIVIGGIEELIFRGFLTSRLIQDFSIWTAGTIASLIFALLHLVWEGKENLPQLPGLWLMGIVLTIAWWLDQQQIALAWGLHAGWVWSIATIDTLELVKYSDVVPEWVTGVGQKPLAGIAGIIALVGTAMTLILLFHSV